MQTASVHRNVNAIEKVEPLPLFHFWVGLSIKKGSYRKYKKLIDREHNCTTSNRMIKTIHYETIKPFVPELVQVFN